MKTIGKAILFGIGLELGRSISSGVSLTVYSKLMKYDWWRKASEKASEYRMRLRYQNKKAMERLQKED